MCLLAIDTFFEIDIIEDDLFFGFIYLVDYPILPPAPLLCLSRNLPPHQLRANDMQICSLATYKKRIENDSTHLHRSP